MAFSTLEKLREWRRQADEANRVEALIIENSCRERLHMPPREEMDRNVESNKR